MRANLERFERRAEPLAEHRAAAVSLTLLPDARGEPCFLITMRAARMNRHAGQFAFPGGRLDAGETAEQAGVWMPARPRSRPPCGSCPRRWD